MSLLCHILFHTQDDADVKDNDLGETTDGNGEKEPEEDDTNVEYEAAISGYTIEIEQLKHQISGLEEQLSAATLEKEDTKKKVKAQASQLKANTTEAIKLQASLDSITTKYEETSTKVDHLLEQITEYKDTISTIESKRDELEMKYKKLKSEKTVSDAKYNSTISNLEKQVNESQATIIKNMKQYKDLELKHKQCNNDLQQVTEEKKTLVSQALVNTDTITQLTMKVDEKQDTISSLKSRVTAVVQEKNNLQVNLKKKVTELELEAATAKEELDKNKGTISRLEGDLNQFNDEKQALDNKYKLLSNDNAMKVQEVDKLLGEKKEMEVRYGSELKLLKDTHKVEVDEKQDTICSLKKQVNAVVQEKNDLQTQNTTLKIKNVSLNDKITVSELEVVTVKEELDKSKDTISSLKTGVQQLKEENEALDNKYRLVSNENDMKVQQVGKLLSERKDMKIEYENDVKRLKDTHKVNLDTLRLEMDASAKKSIDMLRSEADAKQLRTNELQSRLEMSKSTCDDLSKELADANKQVQLEKDHLLVKEQHISNLKMKNDDLRKTNDNVVKRIMATLHNSETEVRKLRAEVRKLQGIKKSTNINGLPTGKGGRRKKQSDPITNIPKVKWDDIIGNQTAKDVLLELPMCRNANDDDLYEEEADEDDDNTGILFFGPHGTVSDLSLCIHSLFVMLLISLCQLLRT